MSDFVSSGWSVWVTVMALAGIIGCGVFLKITSIRRDGVAGKVETMGHTWDGDLAEYNNPMPRWWMWLFYLTVAFGLVYLVLYPGLGSYAGVWGWSSTGQWENEQKKANEQYGPIFAKFAQQDIKTLSADPDAHRIGERLFLNYCAQCHGSDARGARGFPNLTDNDWLYGGEPEKIEETIANGRGGMMPPMGEAIGGEQAVKEVANYVLSLSGANHDAALAAAGKPKFETVCGACHTPAGTGNQALGAPNLTDKIWLYGGSEKTIVETITKGRNGHMPAHKALLGDAKVHLLAAYVYGLSQGGGKAAQ
jgi:cytochrome c oxidase cbb3-type subunit III